MSGRFECGAEVGMSGYVGGKVSESVDLNVELRLG